MTYPAYPAYKDSGVAWLGDVPLHWTTTRLSYCATIMTGGTPDRSNLTYWDEGTINWMSSGEVNKGFIYAVDSKITPEGVQNSNARLLPINSVMVALNGQGKTKATAAILKVESTCNQSLAAIICNAAKLDYFYLYFYLQSRYKDLRGLVGDDAREGLNLSLLKSVPLYCPPLPEQAAIAAFLDRETAKIAALIAKQERMIALLGEKRQALISHAVTKGLRADVPMKDSGVAWLGEIPAHWHRFALKHLVTIPVTDGPHETPTFVDDGIPFLSAESIKGNRLDFNRKRGYISPELHQLYSQKCQPQRNDIFMVKSGNTTGNIALVETDEVFDIWSPLALIRCDKSRVLARFTYYSMLSKPFQTNVNLSASYGTQPNIGMGVIENLPIAFPPSLKEQEAIVSHLDQETRKVEEVIAKAQQAIALMREHRTSLIAAAVTGKIDVRGEVAGAAAGSEAEAEAGRLAGVAR